MNGTIATETRRPASLQGLVKCPSLTHLDLFSGIGGFALAAQAAGFTTIGFSEIEPYACKILKRHWPTVPNYGDIRNVRGLRADLITGGFPCQPYSTAGKRGGASDDRALWPEMFRVIGETRPTWVLGENVPGIISMELDRVLDDLESIGYAAWPLGIPACAVDARHRRERIWIVAYSEHERRNASAINRKPASDDRRQKQPKEQTEQSEGSDLLADAKCLPAGTRRPGRSEAWPETAISGENVADSECERTTHDGQGQTHRTAGTLQSNSSERERIRSDSRERNDDGGRVWPTEPAVGRVADGIPSRSHRLRGLGNAIVPQVAETLIREMARTLNAQAHGQ